MKKITAVTAIMLVMLMIFTGCSGGTVDTSSSVIETIPPVTKTKATSASTTAQTQKVTEAASIQTNVTQAEKKPLKYTALGDSIAYGYALEKPEAQSYPAQYAALLSEKYTVDFNNCAVSGDTSSDMIGRIRSGEAAALKDSDLVTITIGANNLLGSLVGLVMEVMQKYGISLDTITVDYVGFIQNSDKTDTAAIDKLNLAAAYINEKLGSDEFKKKLEAGVETLKTDIPVFISLIRELAPEAKIVYTTVYNPFAGMTLTLPYIKTSIELDTVSKTYIEMLNAAISGASADNGYAVVDLYDPFGTSDNVLTNIYIKVLPPSFSFDPHPNLKGHTLIAGLLMAGVKTPQ